MLILVLNQPPIQWVPGALSMGINWSESEADHTPPSNAEAKNGGAIPPTYVFMAWWLIN
jgi:hypothetical protein